jgi:hypothetical protein
MSAMLLGCSAEKKAYKAFKLAKYQNSIDIYKKLASGSNSGKLIFTSENHIDFQTESKKLNLLC